MRYAPELAMALPWALLAALAIVLLVVRWAA